MAKGNAAGHQPLSYRDRLRLNAAIKHLRSRFHSVRIAAHREIQAILHKKRGVRRLREWVAKSTRAGVRKVTPKPLHRALGVQAKAAPAQARAKGADPLVRDMPRHGLRAPGGFGQTTADLRERARDARTAAPQPGQSRVNAPGAQPWVMRPHQWWANAPRKDRTAGTPAPTLQQERAAARDPRYPYAAGRTPSRAELARIHRTEAARARTEHDFGGAHTHEREAQALERPAAKDPWDAFPRRDAKDAPKVRPLPAATVDRTPREPRVRMPRLRRAQS